MVPHRITERQKAGKARSIKENSSKNSRNTVSKQLIEAPQFSKRDIFGKEYPEYRTSVRQGVYLIVVLL